MVVGGGVAGVDERGVVDEDDIGVLSFPSFLLVSIVVGELEFILWSPDLSFFFGFRAVLVLDCCLTSLADTSESSTYN